ncbi:class III extradiol ring-cleavage dioxygenase [Caulobacter sp. RHG1]|uniref:DODA-type extradiol aromatic ring-opening family dioxygenase n=1 Tax=Caulobacter sp. (strain RHG1) TaxID=2545762 RepID=UPI00155317FC|nr:class III extradiol ring-cleavage dioxygenase [Caulobacter sp. RHG1]NQE64301.1 hypothetical protein [Caulobacter sp. RHG1]
MTTNRLPTFFISHGGGPWPWMRGMAQGPYAKLAASLQRMPAEAGGKPAAILMISAHWEEPVFTVQTHPAPPMLYDYYGFPEEAYHIRYDAAGAPALAKRVTELLGAAGIASAQDPERGYDHGMFAPMAVAYPQADMPTVQLSLRAGLDPLAHVQLGRALAPLRDEGILLVGSGLSYHNLRNFGPGAAQASGAFDTWLQTTLMQPPEQRLRGLLDWERAPSARAAHPREEHLLPLMVALGAAEEEMANLAYHERDFMGGITVSSFRFGPTA